MYTEPLQRLTLHIERGLNAVFSQRYNPFYYHGALPNFFIWVLYLTGLLLFAYYMPTLAGAYDSFLDQFETSEGGSIKVGHEPQAEALEDEDVEQEQIVKQKRG